MEYSEFFLAALALAAGGVLKGAFGVGAPLLAIPTLAIFYDVPFAVAIFTLPSLVTNIWQGWAYREHRAAKRFLVRFVGAGALGALVGSVLLAALPSEFLMAIVALVVFAYIGLRLARSDLVLSRGAGLRFAGLAGVIAGGLQGAGGISAPVSITYLNAMRMERSEFMATISIFFAVVNLVQIPTLWTVGILTPDRLMLSALAIVPLFGAMPLGAWLARFVSKTMFDKFILALLALIAFRLLFAAIL